MSHGHRLRDVDDVQRRSRVAQKPNHPKEKGVATIEEIKRNSSCWRYQNVRFRSVSKIGKNAVISVLYLRGGYFEVDKIVIDK